MIMKTKRTFSILCKLQRLNKCLLLSAFCLLLSIGVFAQCPYYYWSPQGKICVERYNKMRYILVDEEEDTFIVKEKLEKLGYTVSDFQKTYTNYNPYQSPFVKEQYWTKIESSNPNDTTILNIDEISYDALYSYLSFQIIIMGISHSFGVGLHSLADTIRLDSMAKVHNVTIIGNGKVVPLSFRLSCSKNSAGNAFEMANLFYESGLFEWAQNDVQPFGTLSVPSITKNNYSIYPNPAMDYLKILNAEELNLYNNFVEILDISGRRVLFQNYEDEIDISMLKSGFYVIKIYKNKEIVTIDKFVKL